MEKKYVTHMDVENFNMLSPLLSATYKEMLEFSKKKPDSPVNPYKASSINRLLEPLKSLMKEDKVYEYLDLLDDTSLPTNSDVVLILSQYIKATSMYFESRHVQNLQSHQSEWNFEPVVQPEQVQQKKRK